MNVNQRHHHIQQYIRLRSISYCVGYCVHLYQFDIDFVLN